MKLKTLIEVDDEAIVTHLLAEVQTRLHGPDFSSCDVVTFTGAVVEHPGDYYAPDPPDAGTLGVIGAWIIDPGYYSVLFVDPKTGETVQSTAMAAEMQAREATVA